MKIKSLDSHKRQDAFRNGILDMLKLAGKNGNDAQFIFCACHLIHGENEWIHPSIEKKVEKAA